ncbi:MAG: dTMP kinase, partial [Synergistaceae bacterium]|nr:dTMP kinase [Synergistaceae bacterium]
MKGLFIVIEGVDGSGKSTQAEKLAKWLEARTGKKTLRTFEPFALRDLILGRKDFCAMTELLLFLADRSEHVNKIIKPNINAGNNVICERYNDSTLAYQAGGHAIDISQARNLIEACNFPEPDIKIFLDLSPEIAYSRVRERHNLNDKFEDEGFELVRKVCDFYRDEFALPPPAHPV